ncbi:MAG: hypothetical protein IPO58_06020 [Betaproteobacteria bacterium]|nr:hypothetical protein [Betaproteobacteria bacterium]
MAIFALDVEDEVTFASYLVRLRTRSGAQRDLAELPIEQHGVLELREKSGFVSLHQAKSQLKRYGQMIAVPILNSRAKQDDIVEHVPFYRPE